MGRRTRRAPDAETPVEPRDRGRAGSARLWLAVVLAGGVMVAAWWGSGWLVRRAEQSRIPAAGDLSHLPGPVQEQLRQADDAARARPRDGQAAGALAMAWHASLVPERALAEYERASALAPADSQWTYYQGLIHEEHGRQRQAGEAYAAVTRQSPTHGLAWFRLAEIAFKQGRLDEAEDAYVKAGQAPPVAPFAPAGVVRQVLPLSAYAQFGLARIALDRGLLPQATGTLNALVQMYPAFGPARTLRGQLASAGDAQAASTAVSQAYVPPADPWLEAVVAQSRMRDMLLKYAAMAARGGDAGWREYLVRRALQFAPRDPNVLMEMATLLREAGKCDEALGHLRLRAEVVPEDHVTGIEQGRCLSELGRLEEAEAVLRKAARVRDAAAEYNLGAVLDRMGRGDEARQHYERALDIDPFNGRALSNLAVWFDRRGQTAAAVTLLRRAVQAAPDNAEAHSNLGSVLIGARRLPEALAALRTALDLDPDAPEALNNMGIALAQSGRLAEAAEHFRRALAINPNHLNARRNLERLASLGR